MNKWLIFATMCLSTSTFASGIPVVDAASIAQMVKEGVTRAKEFAEEMKEHQARLMEMQAQGEHYKRMVDGHFNFEDILNDPYLNQYMSMEDWKEIYENTQELYDLREEFGLFSDDPKLQQRWDNKLRQYQLRQRYYEQAVKRNKRMQSLNDQFRTATTPAAKADISNAINYENMQMQNDSKLMTTLDSLIEQQDKMERSSLAREKTKLLFGDGIPRSKR